MKHNIVQMAYDPGCLSAYYKVLVELGCLVELAK